MGPKALLLKSSHRRLFLSFMFVFLMATACGTLHVAVDVAPTAEPVTRPAAVLATRADARPGVPPTPTAWFSELPPWADEASVTFDDRMELIGFTVEPQSAGQGSTVTVTLIWRVLDKIDAEYNTFVHVVNEAGQLLAQSDRPTGMGYREPASWIIDELIYDQHKLMLPAGKTSNDIEIRVGLYDFARGERADVDGSNSYTIKKVTTPTPEVTPTPLPTPKAIITPRIDEAESGPPQDLAQLQELAGLRIAYRKGGDEVWIWEAGSGPMQLTEGGEVGEVWISDDGQKIAFIRDRNIWVVDSEGGSARQLTREEDFQGLSTDEEIDLDETGVFPFQVAWRPDSHQLYFNLHPNIEGIELRLLHDLWVVDADSGTLSMLLPPDEGGKFYFSPDGQRLAVVNRSQIDLMDADGNNRREALSHDHDYYAVPVWAPDSSSLRVVIPPDHRNRTTVQTQPTSIWYIPVKDQTETAFLIGEVTAYSAVNRPPLFTPDLARLAYIVGDNPEDQAENDILGVAISELGHGTVWDPVIYQEDVDYINGWSPDSNRLLLRSRLAPISGITMGQPDITPWVSRESNCFISNATWIDPYRFMYSRTHTAGWELLLHHVDQSDSVLIDSGTYSPVYFDFTWLPGTTELPAMDPPSQPAGELATGIAEVDRAIAIILENDIELRRDLVQFKTSGCTQELGMGGPPKCESGQEEGTPVDHFPILGPGEGMHIEPEDIDLVLDFHAESLYAAFRHKDEPDLETSFEPGAHVLVFPTGDADGANVLVHLNEEGKMVRLDTISYLSAWSLEEHFERMVAEWLIAPP